MLNDLDWLFSESMGKHMGPSTLSCPAPERISQAAGPGLEDLFQDK